ARAPGLGADGASYRRPLEPLAARWDTLLAAIERPVVHLPHHPLLLARFGLPGLLPSPVAARWLFKDARARALLAGVAAHSFLPLDAPLTTTFVFLLGVSAHAAGWPLARGGSQRIVDALASYLR